MSAPSSFWIVFDQASDLHRAIAAGDCEAPNVLFTEFDRVTRFLVIVVSRSNSRERFSAPTFDLAYGTTGQTLKLEICVIDRHGWLKFGDGDRNRNVIEELLEPITL